MKCLLPLTALLLLTFFAASCGPSYECQCTTTTTYAAGNTETGTLTKSFTGPRSHAKTNCDRETMSYTVDEYTYSANCILQ